MVRHTLEKIGAAVLGILAPVAIAVACQTTITFATPPTSDSCGRTPNGAYFCIAGTAPQSGSCSGSADKGITCTISVQNPTVRRGCQATATGCTYSQPNAVKTYGIPVAAPCP